MRSLLLRHRPEASRIHRFVAVAVLVTLTVSASCARKAGPRVVPETSAITQAALLPLPARVEWTTGAFTLSSQTVIVAPGELEPIGRFLSAHVGLGAGPSPLRVQASPDVAGENAIVLQQSASVPAAEHYTLVVTPQRITIAGHDLAGVFYGVQTLRQMLPARFEHRALRYARGAPPARVPAVSISDGPRYPWRGAMLDVARHFFTADDVKRYIDLMALHKLNRLHLHLSDDQGWRIEIKSWPNLALYGATTEVGGGAGGYYTQAQYSEIVRYAADRFITVVPEIDMPGHTNAALASYAELNCDRVARPLYTGIDVGFSALCVESDVTYEFIDDVVREIAALTPGPYFHVGGDEVKTLSADAYARFIERVQEIVRSHGKRMIGWDEIAAARLPPDAIVQQWRPKTIPGAAVALGAKVIMSIADRAYLDMKYDDETPIGLVWAGRISVQASYEWDPATIVPDVPPAALLGVEAPLWSETLADINDVELLAFPRLGAIAEIAWTPQAQRSWAEFRERLGAQAARWVALGLNFYRAPEIPWRLPASGSRAPTPTTD